MPKIVHRLSKHPIAKRWYQIQYRCYDKTHYAYKDYGGRGIKCEWDNITDFINDMYPSFKPGLTIDRKDNDGNYSKDNCRWITRKDQSNNRRSNVISGGLKSYCINNGLSYELIKKRMYRGATFEKALSMELQVHNKTA